MRRREFIALASAATASAALIGYPRLTRAQQTLQNPGTWLRSGPMLGHSEMTETEVWLQTNRPCRAEVRYWKRGKPEAARLSNAVDTNEASDFIARFKLS